jgi:hypothetical protein
MHQEIQEMGYLSKHMGSQASKHVTPGQQVCELAEFRIYSAEQWHLPHW